MSTAPVPFNLQVSNPYRQLDLIPKDKLFPSIVDIHAARNGPDLIPHLKCYIP